MSVVLAEENNAVVNSEELIGTTVCLTLLTWCRINRCRYNRVRRYCKNWIILFMETCIALLTFYSKTCLKRNAIVPDFFFSFSQVSILQRVVF